LHDRAYLARVGLELRIVAAFIAIERAL
jgi:hypothetical protein